MGDNVLANIDQVAADAQAQDPPATPSRQDLFRAQCDAIVDHLVERWYSVVRSGTVTIPAGQINAFVQETLGVTVGSPAVACVMQAADPGVVLSRVWWQNSVLWIQLSAAPAADVTIAWTVDGRS